MNTKHASVFVLVVATICAAMTGLVLAWASPACADPKTPIGSVTLFVAQPKSGETGVYEGAVVTTEPAEAADDVDEVVLTWRDSGNEDVTDTFEAGETYTVTATVTLKDGSAFEFDGGTTWKLEDGLEDVYAEMAAYDEEGRAWASCTYTYPTLAKKYSYVTVIADENGESATAEPTAGVEGDEITLSAIAKKGYTLKEWTLEEGEDSGAILEGDTLTMGGSDVTVMATFEKATYTIATEETQNGTLVVDETAQYGDEVIVVATPDDGYVLQQLTYTTEDGEETDITAEGSFIMPDSNVEVRAAFAEVVVYKVSLECKVDDVSGGGSASADPGEGATGTVVTLKAVPNVKSTFDRWEIVEGVDATIEGDELTIGTSDVTVCAYFKAKKRPGMSLQPVTNKPAPTPAPVSNPDPDPEPIASSQPAPNTASDTTSDTGAATGITSQNSEPQAPQMGASSGRLFVSRGTDITYTITQKIPSNATYIRIEHALEPVMSYDTSADNVVVRARGGGDVSANVFIDGQNLVVILDDENAVAALRDKTLEVQFSARVDDDADLSPYLNAAGTTASIPYQATTYFDANGDAVISSEEEAIKVSVGSGSGSSTALKKATRSADTGKNTGKNTGSLAKTSDPSSLSTLLLFAFAGVGAIVVGEVKRS